MLRCNETIASWSPASALPARPRLDNSEERAARTSAPLCPADAARSRNRSARRAATAFIDSGEKMSPPDSKSRDAENFASGRNDCAIADTISGLESPAEARARTPAFARSSSDFARDIAPCAASISASVSASLIFLSARFWLARAAFTPGLRRYNSSSRKSLCCFLIASSCLSSCLPANDSADIDDCAMESARASKDCASESVSVFCFSNESFSALVRSSADRPLLIHFVRARYPWRAITLPSATKRPVVLPMTKPSWVMLLLIARSFCSAPPVADMKSSTM